ncbi:MAG: HNH endonuclease [uncultured bacterium]|nr:MAG: HNH endonuclease [uncultured bacterium]
MPKRALRTCAFHGCPELVNSGYCEKHKPVIASQADDYHPQWQHLYDSRKWKRLRRIQLTKEPWCAECLRANIFTAATDADHVDPHRGNPDLFFKGKLQSLCKPCHSRKTANEVNGRGVKSLEVRERQARG